MQIRSNRNGKRIKLKPRFFVIMGVLVILAALLIFKIVSGIAGSSSDSNDKQAEESKPAPVAPKIVDVKVTAAGDSMTHVPVLDAARQDKGYDFTPTFKYIKNYIEEADVAFCTFEGSFVDSDFSGYPLFRSPKKLAKDLKAVGFDVLNVTSNHAVDGGDEGFNSTIKATKDAGLIVSGAQEKKEDPDYAMVEKDGVKVAIISYCYSDGSVEQPALNGSPLSEDVAARCNTFNMKDKEGAAKDAARVEEEARKAGAGIVILHMHWGDEYQTHSNEEQQKLAQMFVDGTTCDVIVGSHPHVVQEYSLIKSADGKRSVPCYFAIGNMISNQRRELLGGDVHVEEGVMVQFDFKYDANEKKLTEIKETRIPYWSDKYYNDNGKPKFRLIPLVGDFSGNEALNVSGHTDLATQAKKGLEQILGGKGQ